MFVRRTNSIAPFGAMAAGGLTSVRHQVDTVINAATAILPAAMRIDRFSRNRNTGSNALSLSEVWFSESCGASHGTQVEAGRARIIGARKKNNTSPRA